MTGRRIHAAAALLLLAAAAPPSGAATDLRWEPGTPAVDVGGTAVVSIMLDDAVEVRTLEVWVRYDAGLVRSEGGAPGALFTQSGCPLFPVSDHVTDGVWYGGVATLGPTCFTTGPGELYRWEFTGLADGTCPVVVDSLALYDALADPIPDVRLAATVILVGDATSVEPTPSPPLELSLFPNPFNPRALVRFGGPAGEALTLEVLDPYGRRVVLLWHGPAADGSAGLAWDGRDDAGREAPGGVYLFRLRGRAGPGLVRKGVLLR